ncbi:uncharacterized protein LOC112142242 isoform X3 [Oryzias melastigma]|uniref:uncharacterized protein LOC112142242 isoform X3 n=1 Tax=Oryzias melastigma TaxID=30732 RepID=UPI00168CEAE3|nr:uncharacterized protein LOC112142242 isoform X3 [Oryzias melastigma]
MSSFAQKESVSEQIPADEGTVVQNEEELCGQRRLLDVTWKPQLQLHVIVIKLRAVTHAKKHSGEESAQMAQADGWRKSKNGFVVEVQRK